jgi:DNA-directed RNA polymerase delta subunit
VLSPRRHARVLRATLKEIYHILIQRYPSGLTPHKLYVVLKEVLGREAPSPIELRSLARSLRGIEMANGRYRAEMGFLKRKSDRCERILLQRGQLMHFREVARKLDEVKSASNRQYARRVARILAEDHRFIAIGRTGLWGLAEYGPFETRSLADIAAERLGNSKTPLREETIFDFISARRPVTQSSLRVSLDRDKRFHKVGPRTWKLNKNRCPPLKNR